MTGTGRVDGCLDSDETAVSIRRLCEDKAERGGWLHHAVGQTQGVYVYSHDRMSEGRTGREDRVFYFMDY